ncbi:MAG: glycine cleavage system protein GcvH [Acidobacteria bacterium]|nr:glycine cleavage system protein GcvH [Acidobacteriota bacterium]MCZ6728024.1 glycine cleavage system protein GcvH [Acidobacteriota bacterium]
MYPETDRYSKEHEWFRLEGDSCVVGITDFAQDELGEVVFVDLPEVGSTFEAGDEIGTIESVKAVSEIYTAVGGEVTAINEALTDAPEKVNEDPHGDGWLVRFKLASPSDLDGLMKAAEYEEFTRNG